jgi:hypothetical protein
VSGDPISLDGVVVTFDTAPIADALRFFQRLDALGEHRDRLTGAQRDRDHSEEQFVNPASEFSATGDRVTSPDLGDASEIGQSVDGLAQFSQGLGQFVVHGKLPHWLAVTVRLGAAGLAGAGLAHLLTRRAAS